MTKAVHLLAFHQLAFAGNDDIEALPESSKVKVSSKISHRLSSLVTAAIGFASGLYLGRYKFPHIPIKTTAVSDSLRESPGELVRDPLATHSEKASGGGDPREDLMKSLRSRAAVPREGVAAEGAEEVMRDLLAASDNPEAVSSDKDAIRARVLGSVVGSAPPRLPFDLTEARRPRKERSRGEPEAPKAKAAAPTTGKPTGGVGGVPAGLNLPERVEGGGVSQIDALLQEKKDERKGQDEKKVDFRGVLRRSNP